MSRHSLHALGITGLVLAAFAATPAPAEAAVHGVSSPPVRLPIAGAPLKASSTAPTSTAPLAYGGGAVQVSPSVFLSFWGTQWQSGFSTNGYSSSAAQNYLRQFFSGAGGSSWIDSTLQYCQGTTSGSSTCAAGATSITSPSGQLRGTWVDTTTAPATPTDADIQAAAERAFAHFGLVDGAIYFVITPTGHSSSGFGTQWCAWHSSDYYSGRHLAYTYLPYIPDAGIACGRNYVNASNDSFGHGYFDGFSIVGGHEYAEAITDPNPSSGWTDANGDENADKCQWSKGPAGNTSLSTGSFAVQSLWSNSAGACVMSAAAPGQAPNPTPTPTPSPTPTPAPTPTPTPVPAPPPSASVGPYVLDGFGGVHPAGNAPGVSISAYWPGWDIARSLATFPAGGGGYVLDGYGGVHPFGSAPPVPISAAWPGWDIARAITLAPWSSPNNPQGWVMDGFGGIHPFGGAPSIQAGAYWPGWDIAHGVVVGPTSTPSQVWGYTLDGYGGLHPFGGAAPINNMAYWPGWNIARGVQLLPGSTATSPAGYTIDGFGGVHAFGSAPAVAVSAYWPGWDIARGATLAGGSASGGWVLDGFGGLHPFGGAPPIAVTAYWPGWDIAHSASVSGEGGGFNRL